jgi:long-subunit fatty acid transport protein
MKKVLFAIAAMAACVSASAQLWVSGGVEYHGAAITNESTYGDDKAKTTWNFNPAIGYALDDALEVGLELNLNGTSKDDKSTFDFKIAPFARYTFLSEGAFSMFLQGSIDFYSYSGKNPEIKGQRFGASIKPGIKYILTDNFAIAATFGDLSYRHTDKDGSSDQNRFNCSIGSNLSFQLVYSF